MKRTLEFVIDCGQENMDVRTFVRRYLGFSARILTALKYEGEMLKNGEPVHSNAVLKTGDTLTLTLLETGEAYEKADLADENVPRRVRGRNARKRVCECAHRVKAGA